MSYQVVLNSKHFIFGLFQARVEQHHEVLDIGCGWGSLAIEIVRKTGCKYTGITLAEEQLKLAEQRVKEAGLQVCDYIASLVIFPFYFARHYHVLFCLNFA